jgi:hypothetical protein
MNDEDKKAKVVELFRDNAKPKRARRKDSTPVASQSIEDGDYNTQIGNGLPVNQSIKGGSHNIQAAGMVNLTIRHEKPKSVKVTVAPPPGSIGANSLLKERIQGLFATLGERRKKRYGATAFRVMYGKFKADFDIPEEQPWTIIWTWPEGRGDEIVRYLTAKCDQTIDGKIEKAAKRPGYRHSRGHLFRIEKELLAQLDLEPGSPEVRSELERYFGTSSRKDLSDNQFANWVKHLEAKVKKLYESDD